MRDGAEEEVVECCAVPLWCISRDEVIFHL